MKELNGVNLVGGQIWPPTYFANVKYVQYESGRDQCNVRSTNNPKRDITLSHAVIRHPRMYFLELARLQVNEQAGVTRTCRFTLNLPQTTNPNNWNDFWAYDQGVGTGSSSENANPFDATTALSQTGGAVRAFAAASVAAPATAYTLTTATTGTVGVGQLVTITPTGPYSGKITLSATHGTLGASVFTFTSAAPQTTTYTPTSAGTGALTGTNSGTLTNPPAAKVTITAAPAVAYTLTPATATVAMGVAQTFTIRPGGVFTGTITPHATGSAVVAPSSLTWAVNSTAKTFTVTDAVAETVTVTASSGGALTDPSPAVLTVTDKRRKPGSVGPALRARLAANFFLAPPTGNTPNSGPAGKV
jgi:hypothetical protein